MRNIRQQCIIRHMRQGYTTHHRMKKCFRNSWSALLSTNHEKFWFQVRTDRVGVRKRTRSPRPCLLHFHETESFPSYSQERENIQVKGLPSVCTSVSTSFAPWPSYRSAECCDHFALDALNFSPTDFLLQTLIAIIMCVVRRWAVGSCEVNIWPDHVLLDLNVDICQFMAHYTLTACMLISVNDVKTAAVVMINQTPLVSELGCDMTSRLGVGGDERKWSCLWMAIGRNLLLYHKINTDSESPVKAQ